MQPASGTEKLSLEHKTLLTPDLEAPLVCLVHGRAGNFDVMWTFKRAASVNCNFIAPQALIHEKVAESNVEGFSWWLYNKEENNLEKIYKAAELLSEFMDQAEDAYNLNPGKRFAFGFSQGAALLSLLIQLKPDKFDAVALLSGFVVESGSSISGKRPEIFMAHGTQDHIISIDKAKRGYEYLTKAGFQTEFCTENTAHKIGLSSMRALTTWMDRQIQT